MSTPEVPEPQPKPALDVKKQIRSIVILVILFTVTYYTSQAIQTYMGKRAAKATGLPEMQLATALRQSANANKPVLLNMSAYWCPACRKLDNEVFSHPQVKQKILSDYIYARENIDTEQGERIAKQYNIKGTPGLLILNEKGEVLRWLQIRFRPDHFIEQL